MCRPENFNWVPPAGKEFRQVARYVPEKEVSVILTFDPQAGREQRGAAPP